MKGKQVKYMKQKILEQKEKAKLGIINFLIMANDISYGEAEDIVGETQIKINDCESIGECMKIVEDYLGISGEYVWIFL